MNLKSNKIYKTNWNGTSVQLTEEEYDIAMSHVEAMRHTAEENNTYERLEEGDEDYLDPYGWMLSDTLASALEEGQKEPGWGEKTKQEAIKKGLELFSEDLDFIEPCSDDDADDTAGRWIEIEDKNEI